MTTLQPLKNRDRLVVVGKTGTGKSTWVKRHLERELDAGRRILFVDFCDEYSQEGRADPEVTLGPLRDRLTFEELREEPDLLGASDLSMAVVPSKEAVTCAEQVSELIAMVEGAQDLLFGMDETGMYQEYCQRRLHYLAAQSRHWGVPVIFASQAMVDIPAKARRQATHLVSHLQTHPSDLAALVELTDDETFAERARHLRVGESLHWTDFPSPNHPPRRKKEK